MTWNRNPLLFRDDLGRSWYHWELDNNLRAMMRWGGSWVDPAPNKYPINMVVEHDGWRMISNKETDDPAAPTPQGDPTQVYPAPDPSWTVNQHTGHVYSVMEFTVPADGLYELSEIRVWVEGITPDDHYQVLAQDENGVITELLSFDGDRVTQSGWFDIPWRPDLLPPGGVGRLWLHQWNSGSSDSQTYQWTRLANTNGNGDPGSGNWSTRNNGANVRINDLDDGGTDRSSVITDPGLVGSVIRMTQANDANKWMEFVINSITDEAGWVVYGTSETGSGPGGEPDVGALCDINFQIPVVSTTDYVSLAGHLGQFPALQSYIALDAPNTGVPSQDGVGIDVVFQPFYISPDWEVFYPPPPVGVAGAERTDAMQWTGDYERTPQAIYRKGQVTNRWGATMVARRGTAQDPEPTAEHWDAIGYFVNQCYLGGRPANYSPGGSFSPVTGWESGSASGRFAAPDQAQGLITLPIGGEYRINVALIFEQGNDNKELAILLWLRSSIDGDYVINSLQVSDDKTRWRSMSVAFGHTGRAGETLQLGISRINQSIGTIQFQPCTFDVDMIVPVEALE